MAKYNAKETIEKNTDSVDETKVEKNDSSKKEEKKTAPKLAKKKTFVLSAINFLFKKWPHFLISNSFFLPGITFIRREGREEGENEGSKQ